VYILHPLPNYILYHRPTKARPTKQCCGQSYTGKKHDVIFNDGKWRYSIGPTIARHFPPIPTIDQHAPPLLYTSSGFVGAVLGHLGGLRSGMASAICYWGADTVNLNVSYRWYKYPEADARKGCRNSDVLSGWITHVFAHLLRLTKVMPGLGTWTH
jgi:hypothetical protein